MGLVSLFRSVFGLFYDRSKFEKRADGIAALPLL